MTEAVLPVLFLVGPTAVGKSNIAVALAKKLDGEIVSCDSMQVYKGMDIGTAKPDKKSRARVRHHLIDIVPIARPFNVALYRKKALTAIADILRRGKRPLVVGGTGLYFRALLDGLFQGPGADLRLREKFARLAERKGAVTLHAQLQKVDPEAAAKIHPNNTRKIIRALEVFHSTGKPISRWQKQDNNGRAFPFPFVAIGLDMDRRQLYRRVDQRVKAIFRRGLWQEVQILIKKGLRKNSIACQAIGYKEMLGYLDGSYDEAKAMELVARNSRRFAKRQFTWFKKDARIKWVRVSHGTNVKQITDKIAQWIRDKGETL